MRLSVAICTWNRGPLLAQTLECLTRLEVPPSLSWELVIVDNGSTDDTAQVISSFISRLPIVAVFESQAGLARARNAALAVATGDYILWTDDDVLVDPQWLAALGTCAERHPDAAAFGGPIAPWFVTEPDPLLLEVFPSVRAGFCGVDHGAVERPLAPDEGVHGANFAICRSAAAGLRFDPTLGHSPTSLIGGEEAEFIDAIRAGGGSVIWCPAMCVRPYVAPERLQLPYLERFMIGRGQRLARIERTRLGQTGSGTPLWVYRRLAECSLASVWHQLRGHRRESLASRRDGWVYKGMLLEYRQ